MIFDIFDSVKARGQRCTNELFLAATYNQRLIPLWNKIASCSDKDEQQRLKKMLPGVTWQAHFPGGRRVNAEAEPSGLYMVDIDGVDDPSLVYSEKVAGHLRDCDILCVHITPSRRGLRVVAVCRPEFETLAQNQEWLASVLGVEIDAACKDLARFSYLVPNEYFLYWDGSIWTREPKVIVRHAGPDPASSEIAGRSRVGARDDVARHDASRHPALDAGSQSQDSYRGIPLKDIAAKWLELNGGEPQQGERNTVLFELATRMRYICEFNPDIIAKAIPHCGLPSGEVISLCKSACTTQRSTKMPSDLRMVLKNMEIAGQARNDGNDPRHSGPDGRHPGLDPGSDSASSESSYDPHDEEFLLRLPKLPIGLRESLQGKPEKVKMPILAGIMPLAMAYASDVRVRYCDGKIHRLNGMSIIVGNQASGKSAVADVIKVWKRPMKQADDEQRKLEEEYKAFKKKRKQSERLPDEPNGPILNVPITISCSTLLKRMKRSKGRHLYSFGEELDTLRKTNGAGSWSSKYDVYRMGFDNGEWGQDYNSDQAESGVVNVAYNWTILGTKGAVDKCFKTDSVENGMSGRVLFARLPESNFEHLTVYDASAASGAEEYDLDTAPEEYLSAEQRRMIDAVRVLEMCSGFVDTPRLRKAITAWVNAKADEAREHHDVVLDTFRKRAAVIGFRCAVVFQLLESGGVTGLRESKASVDFAILMADYALKYQTELFGEQLLQVNTTISDVGRKTKNKTLYDDLPQDFTFEMVQSAKPDARYGALRMMLSVWKRNGLIKAVDLNHWQKV